MHAALQTILRLYREPLPPEVAAAHEPAEDVAALAAVRDALDARTASAGRARPDAFVLDQILAAASHGTPVGPPESLGVRFDRTSVPRRHARFRRAVAFVVTGSLAVIAAVVVLLPGGSAAPDAAPAPVVAAVEAPVLPTPAAAPTEASALPVQPVSTAPTPTPPAAAPVVQQASAVVPPRPTAEEEAAAALDAEATTWDEPVTKAAVAKAEMKAQRLSTRLDSTLWDLPSSSSLALPRTTAPSPYLPASHTGNDW